MTTLQRIQTQYDIRNAIYAHLDDYTYDERCNLLRNTETVISMLFAIKRAENTHTPRKGDKKPESEKKPKYVRKG